MSAVLQESFTEAKHRHTDAFGCADLCECITPEILEALKDGDEAYAGHLLRREMLGLIEARATYGAD